MPGSRRRNQRTAILRHRELRSLVAAVGISQMGDWLYYAAFMVYLYEAGGSAAAVGAWIVARQVAYIVVGPLATSLSDRFDRRRWLMGVNFAKLVVMAVLAGIVAVDGPVVLAIVVAFVSSALTSGYVPVMFAAVPDVVPEGDLAPANALMASVEKAAMIGGPLLGAVVLAVTGEPAVAVAINAASFALAALALSHLRTPAHATGTDRERDPGLLARVAVGYRALTASFDASVITLLSVTALVVFGFEQVLFVVISSEQLGTGSNGVTALIAAHGVGGILGSLLAVRVAARSRTVPIMATAFVVAQLPLAVLTLVERAAPAYLVLAAGGGAFVVFQVLAVTVLQRAVPARSLAHVWAIALSLGYAGTLLGSVSASFLADQLGLHPAMVVPTAVGLIVIALLARPLARLDREDAARARAVAGVADELAAISIFAGAPRIAVELLARDLVEQRLDVGAVPIRAGDEPDDFYVIRSGRFDVHADIDGDHRLVNQMGPGDWFGEIGLVRRRPRTATVTVTEPALVWRIPGGSFLDALEFNAALPGPLQASIGQRLSRTHMDDEATLVE